MKVNLRFIFNDDPKKQIFEVLDLSREILGMTTIVFENTEKGTIHSMTFKGGWLNDRAIPINRSYFELMNKKEYEPCVCRKYSKPFCKRYKFITKGGFMTCDCIKTLTERSIKNVRNRNQDSRDIKVVIGNEGVFISEDDNGNELVSKPYINSKVSYKLVTKKGKTVSRKYEISCFYSYCPFCGKPLKDNI